MARNNLEKYPVLFKELFTNSNLIGGAICKEYISHDLPASAMEELEKMRQDGSVVLIEDFNHITNPRMDKIFVFWEWPPGLQEEVYKTINKYLKSQQG